MTAPVGAEAFEAERGQLVGLAYRITGSRTEADDVVQDAWLRWQRAGPETVDNLPAWLRTVTSRLALDRLKAAHHQREVYVGPWLPEPIDAEPDPSERAEIAESLTIGFLAMLERLAPVERVVFLLADVFRVPFAEIATVVDRSPAACRQVAARARRRVQDERPRYAATGEAAWEVATAFLMAVQAGDLDTVVGLLADDAVVISDGGAARHAARRPVVAERIPRFMANLARREFTDDDTIVARHVNGQPGVVVVRDGAPWLALAVSVEQGLVHRIWVIINPDKLASLAAGPES